MKSLLLVILGGGLGSGARYLVSLALLGWLGPNLPWGTLLVNLLGSGLLGALIEGGLRAPVISPEVRLLLTTGVMGGFTTYSTYNLETLRMLEQGATALALGYVAVTLVGCLLAGWLGVMGVRWVG